MNNKPVVSASDQLILIGESIDASSFISATDPDGDPIKRYRIYHTGEGGYFAVNGVELAANVVHELTLAEYAQLTYNAGASIGNEEVKIWAFDGVDWSDPAAVHMYSYQNDTAPLVLDVPNQYTLQNEMVRLSDIITAYDPDGRPIEWIGIKDRIAFGGTGSLVNNGAFHTQNTWLWVRPEDLENVFYANGLPQYTEFLDFWAYDGEDWVRDYAWMGVKANKNRPTIQPKSFTEPSNTMLDPNNFVETYDEDGNTIKRYGVYDGNLALNSGYFMLDGVRLDAQVWHDLTAKQFDRLQYYTASEAGNEELRFTAFDGLYTSAVSSITFYSLPKPEIEHTEIIVSDQLETYNFSDYFAQVDDGPVITKYQFYNVNHNPLGTLISQNGTVLEGGQVYEMTAAEFENLSMRTGVYENRWYNQFQVRGFNGQFWTEWNTIEVRSESEINKALYFGSQFPSQNWGQFINARPLTLTYSFFQAYPPGEYETGEATSLALQLTPNQRGAIRRIFAQIASFTNLRFVEVADTLQNEFGGFGGIFRFGNYYVEDSGVAAFAFPPIDPYVPENPHGGDVWFNLFYLDPFNFNEDSFEFMTALHEIGHAVGLKHTFDDIAVLPPPTENRGYSVMSYSPHQLFYPFEPRTYQLYDIHALQQLYGANSVSRSGDDTYTIANYMGGSAGAIATIWDPAGTDLLDVSGSNSNNTVDIREGGSSSLGIGTNNLKIGFGTQIEHVTTGNGNDTIYGNYLDNTIIGNGGRDTIRGDVGNDYLMGGAASDTYIFKVGDGIDVINEDAKAGRDKIVFNDHPWLDDFADDLTFRRENNDLIIDLTINGGLSQGSITIENQAWGGYRIESLVFDGTQVDLVDLFSQVGYVDTHFSITGSTSTFGNLVTPV